jgi:hypothetical protein
VTEVTVYKQLALVHAKTGHQLKLGPFDTITRVSFDDDHNQVRVTMKTARYTEQARRYVVHCTGLRMVIFTPRPGKLRWDREDIEMWDDDSAFEAPKGDYDPGKSERSAKWAELCYRPGTGKTPLDNWERTASDPIHSPAPMQKHWAPTRYTR